MKNKNEKRTRKKLKALGVVTFIIAAISFNSALSQDYNITFAILGSTDKPTEVTVENTTQGTDTTLSGNDILNLVKDLSAGIEDADAITGGLLRVYPNPVKENATAVFNNPAKGNINASIINTAGMQVASMSSIIPKGQVSCIISGLSAGSYVLYVQAPGYHASCVILSRIESKGTPGIEIGSVKAISQQPTISHSAMKSTKSGGETVKMQYNTGDVLKFTATLDTNSATLNDYTATHDDEIEFSFIYTVTFNDWDDTKISIFNGEYGDTIIYPAHPEDRAGYTANGWDMTDTTVPANDDLVITAQYDAIDYNIRYHNAGTKNPASNPAIYNIEDSVSLETATDSTGYAFAGWFTDATFNDTVNSPAIAQGSMGDTAFYAKWDIISYNITYHNIGTKNSPSNPANYTIETSSITLAAPTDSTGFSFGGWFTDAACNDTVSTPAIAQGSIGNAAFYAKWVSLPFTDSRDGKVYKTVAIGDQVWMAENLAYLPSVNMVADGSEDAAGSYYYVYGYDGTNVTDAKATANYTTYGVLYNWTAAMGGESSSASNPSGIQGVCPTGWHLPSDAEWTELTDYLGGTSDAGGKLKETGTTHWNSPNTGATNETGFTALPGGYRYSDGAFYYFGYDGYWWSASEDYATFAWYRSVNYSFSNVFRNYYDMEVGFSVRCVRD